MKFYVSIIQFQKFRIKEIYFKLYCVLLVIMIFVHVKFKTHLRKT